MEKIKSFLHSLRPWQVILIVVVSLAVFFTTLYASLYLRESARLKLGTEAGLLLTADREDSLGTFSDSSFTLKSDTDLTVTGVKNSLVFFPETDFDVKQVTPRQFSITPKTPLKDNSLYRIKVLSDQKTFSWAFQTKNDFRVVQSLPRDKATYVPLNTGIEISFSHDNFEDINRYFEITPFVEGRFEKHFRTISFVPKNLTPDTLYTVKVKKGVKLSGSSVTLKEDYVFQFETRSADQQRPLIGFSGSFYEFSSAETPAFDVFSSSQGSSELSIKVYQYPSTQTFYSDLITKISIPGWASNSQRLHRANTSGLNKVLEFSTPIQQQTYTSYLVFPQTLPTGLYLVESNIGGGGGITTQALVQITDLSAYTSVSGTKTVVWVNDVKTGSPSQGTQVTFQGKTEKTGRDGVAYFDTPNNTLPASEVMTISGQDSILYLPVKNEMFYFESNYLSARRESNKYWSYFYTDRPVYLPDDNVKFWGLLRDRDNLNARQKFTLEVTRSDYNSWDFKPIILFSKDLETSDLGTFIGEIPLSKLNPGWYGISLKIGGNVVLASSFSVETYTKPAYKLSLDVSKQSIIVGDTVSFSGNANFFEGSPVPGMELSHATQGTSGKVITDSLGRFGFNYTPTSDDISNSYSPEYRFFSVTPVLPEEGFISAGLSLPVFSSSYVFNSPQTSVRGASGRVEADLRLVDVNRFSPGSSLDIFNPAGGKNLTGDLVEITWNRREVGTYYDFINKTTSPRYEYDRIETKISDVSLTTNASGKAVYEFSVQNNRSYRVNLRVQDDRGRSTEQSIYVSSFADNYYSQNNYVYLKEDKTGENAGRYSVGEQVGLTVMKGDAPLDSSTSDRFLYLFAQRGLRTYQVSGDNNISFKYSDSFVPNIYVKAVRFTGKTYQVSESLNLMFDTTAKKLSLDITPDKATYLPGSDARLTVFAKNADGSPAQAEVNLSLIDEAYTALYSSPVDPLGRIYTSIDSDLIASYQSHKYPLDLSGAEGGGCFLPGTSILMSDGSIRKIENIRVGDKIKTLAAPGNGKTVSAKVIQIFKHEVSGYLLINGHLRVTAEHNIYINGRWMTAGEIKAGDYYLDSAGEYNKVVSVEKYSGLNTVFNFTVEKYQTYIADGFYVHNQKGRELFVDNAFFGSVRTGADGRAGVDIKLPDNLTSWIITSQGVTADLKAGSDISTLVVKQPFFVDAIMNTNYLVEDKPQILVRSYGEGLSAGDQVSIKIESESLGLNKTVTVKAFETSRVDLGNLSEGEHKLSFTGTSGNQSDKLIRTINITKSRLQSVKSFNTTLTTDTKPEGSADSMTSLVFSDLSLGRFYPPILNLSYTWGDRLDQKLARSISQELIKKYFDDKVVPETVNFTPFMVSDGGYAIYPYAGDDVELSAYVAAMSPDKIDKIGLANYFYKFISTNQDSIDFGKALFGLASLDEPVLLLINNFGQTKNLPPMARLYHALALAKIGDVENARISYRGIMDEFAKNQDQLKYLNIGNNKDLNLQATALAAMLASTVDPGEANGLLAYTFVNSGKDLLLVSPQLITVRNLIALEKPQTVSFAYTLNGKKFNQKLEDGNTFKMELSPKDLADITFSEITGTVGLVSHYLSPLDPKTAKIDPAVQIGRSYSVRGRSTNTFDAADLVRVSMPIKFSELTQDGCYQVSDLLPSGLRPVNAVYNYGISDPNVWYPYEINGQKVSFCVAKSDKGNTINYYARVVSAGDYKAESSIIQSLISPSILNLSPAGSISIK